MPRIRHTPTKFSAASLLLAYMRGHKGKLFIRDLDFLDFSHNQIKEAASRLCRWGTIRRIGLGKYTLNN